MKKTIISILFASSLYCCANLANASSYTESQFETLNYEQNIYNASKYMSSLSEADVQTYPEAQIESQDMPLLMQSEIAFAQGGFAYAGNGYFLLAQKYHDLRFIIKAIACYQRVASPEAKIKSSQLVTLLYQYASNSNLAQLYSIPNDLAQGDLKDAQANLHKLVSADKDNRRNILLALATLLSGKRYVINHSTITEFANFVQDNYGKYPEGLLLATISYSLSYVSESSVAIQPASSIVNDDNQLIASMDIIRTKFPTWELPVLWVAGLLVSENESGVLYELINRDMVKRTNPSAELQNLYVAVLLKLNRTDEATQYIDSSTAYKAHAGTMLVNKAIVEYKLVNLPATQNLLAQALKQGYTLDGVVELTLGALSLKQGYNLPAVSYFESAIHANPLIMSIAGIGVVQAYIFANDIKAADQYIKRMASLSGNVDEAQILATRISIFISFKQYAYAYKIASTEARKYMKNSTVVYQYATAATFMNKNTEAIKLYKQYIKMAPKNAEGYNDYAYLLSEKTKQYQQAVEMAQKAYELAPNDPAVLDTLGWAYYKNHQYHQAVNYLNKAYVITYNNEIGEHLRYALIASGNNKAAEAIHLTPNIPVSAELIKQQLLDQSILMLLYYQFGAGISVQ